jgi:hypothetical protein
MKHRHPRIPVVSWSDIRGFDLSFIEADGFLRPGHNIFNAY